MFRFSDFSSWRWFFFIIPLIILYLMKFRRSRLIVSSLMLWNSASKDIKSNSFSYKFKRNLLLFLQIIFLIMCVLSLMQPYLKTKSASFTKTIIVIDNSLSMTVRDESGESRLTAAKKYISKIIDSLPDGGQIMIITGSSDNADYIPVSSDRILLKKFVNGIQPVFSGSDLTKSMQIAMNSLKQMQADAILILSDGKIILQDNIAEKTNIKIFGYSDKNCGITDFSVKPALENRMRIYSAFVNIHNFSSQDLNVTLYLFLNDKIIDTRKLSIKSENDFSVTNKIYSDSGILRYVINSENDFYEYDDEAYLSLAGIDKTNIYYLGNDNIFLKKILTLKDDYIIHNLTMKEYEKSIFKLEDLVIVDGIKINKMRVCNHIFFKEPPPESGSFTDIAAGKINFQSKKCFFLQNINFDNISFDRLYSNRPPLWAESNAECGDKSIIWSGELKDKRRIVYFGFDILESNLPLNHSFISMLYDTVKWVKNPEKYGKSYYLTGEYTSLNSDYKKIIMPNGSEKNTGNLLKFSIPGLYKITNSDLSQNVICVNMKNKFESDIKPQHNLKAGAVEIKKIEDGSFSDRQIWLYLCLLAFAILLIEWRLYLKH